MRTRNAVIALLLLWIAACRTARPPATHHVEGMEDPLAAAKWRHETMVDENGEIPPGAIERAILQRRENLRAQQRGGRRLIANSASISPNGWTFVGPDDIGGRTLALLVHPEDATHNTLLAGTASGGLWKSTDKGATWNSVVGMPSSYPIGALVSGAWNSTTGHYTLYAGTGEQVYDRPFTDIRGGGVFRSDDGGTTWQPLAQTQTWTYVLSLAVHPGNPQIILAATNSGIQRSIDGGANWSAVTIVPSGSVSVTRGLTVAFHPSMNSSQAVAGVEVVNGSGTVQTVKAFFSSDYGATFNEVLGPAVNGPGDGSRPTISMAYALSNPSVVYAIAGRGYFLYETQYFETWKSIDGGQSYTKQSQSTSVYGCMDRLCVLWVSPQNPNLLVAGGYHHYRSTNGGTTWPDTISDNEQVLGQGEPHVDQHCIVSESPTSSAVYVCSDGGVWRSDNIASSDPPWTRLTRSFRTTQFHGAAGYTTSGNSTYFGGLQDNGVLFFTPPSLDTQIVKDGTDGGVVDIDPNDPTLWYYSTPPLTLFRRQYPSGEEQLIKNPDPDANFIAPFVLDPNSPNTMLAGALVLYRTTNARTQSAANQWSTIRNAGTKPISAIAVARGNSDIIWVGQNNGVIEKTTNGTIATPSWTNADPNSTLPNRYIARILIDPSNSNLVYVALGGYTDGSSPNLWKTTNGGASWVSASGSGATSLPFAPIRAIARHPRNAQRLYAGTDVGIYESEDGGATWLAQSGPDDVPVDELRFVIGSEKLLAATHGRGLWVHDVSSVPGTPGPTSLTATTIDVLKVRVTWPLVSGATYQVERAPARNGSFQPLGSPVSAPPYDDILSSTPDPVTYVYRVRAIVSGVSSDPSPLDFATVGASLFSAQPLASGALIRASHVQELRKSIDALRVATGQLTPAWSSSTAPSGFIRAADINALIPTLDPALEPFGRGPFAYVNVSSPAANGSVHRDHIQQLVDALK